MAIAPLATPLNGIIAAISTVPSSTAGKEPTQTDSDSSPAGSSIKQLVVAGIELTVYGLDRLDQHISAHGTGNKDGPADVMCMWVHHGRMGDAESMRGQTEKIVKTVYDRLDQIAAPERLFIAVAFDQRNHGTRLMNDTADLDWRAGNDAHATDMYGIFEGTANDNSQLLRLAEAYIFPTGADGRAKGAIKSHAALGFSLGGHVAWQLAAREPKIETVIAVAGTPDYKRLMHSRAIRDGRITDGQRFFPSADFPPALLEEVERTDPMQKLFERPGLNPGLDQDHVRVDRALGGKRMLVLAGGNDKMVPFDVCVRPFLERVENAIQSGVGQIKMAVDLVLAEPVEIETRIFNGVGHAFNREMVQVAADYMADTVVRSTRTTARL